MKQYLHSIHSSDERDVSKVRGHVEVRLVRYAPGTIRLVRICGGTRDGAEEVHAPLGALGRAIVDVEEAEGKLDVRNPHACIVVERGAGNDAVGGQIRDVEAVEGSAGCADLGRVVDEGLEGDIVGGDLELEVSLRVVGPMVLRRVSVIDAYVMI